MLYVVMDGRYGVSDGVGVSDNVLREVYSRSWIVSGGEWCRVYGR